MPPPWLPQCRMSLSVYQSLRLSTKASASALLCGSIVVDFHEGRHPLPVVGRQAYRCLGLLLGVGFLAKGAYSVQR